MSLHHFEDDPDEDRGRGLRWVVYGVCAAILFTMTIGLAWSTTRSTQVEPPTTALRTVPPPSDGTKPKVKRETVAPAETVKPQFPVDPECWETRPAAEETGCQTSVRDSTKFIPRYETNQAELARTHPKVKLTDTGREANSLARHGLLTCWLVRSPKYSLDDIRSAFFLLFHRHPFTVLDDDMDAAADNVISVAVQEICPSEAAALERKGGPKAELVTP